MYERQITHVENEVHPCDKAVSPWGRNHFVTLRKQPPDVGSGGCSPVSMKHAAYSRKIISIQTPRCRAHPRRRRKRMP